MISISEDSFSSGKSFNSKLETRYYLILCLPIIGFLPIYLKLSGQPTEDVSAHVITQTAIVVAVLLALTLAGMLYYRKKIRALRELDISLRQKMVRYFRASILLYLWIEVFGAILVVLYHQTEIGYYSIAFGLHVIVISAERPNKHRLARHLRLKGEDRNAIIFEQPLN